MRVRLDPSSPLPFGNGAKRHFKGISHILERGDQMRALVQMLGADTAVASCIGDAQKII